MDFMSMLRAVHARWCYVHAYMTYKALYLHSLFLKKRKLIFGDEKV